MSEKSRVREFTKAARLIRRVHEKALSGPELASTQREFADLSSEVRNELVFDLAIRAATKILEKAAVQDIASLFSSDEERLFRNIVQLLEKTPGAKNTLELYEQVSSRHVWLRSRNELKNFLYMTAPRGGQTDEEKQAEEDFRNRLSFAAEAGRYLPKEILPKQDKKDLERQIDDEIKLHSSQRQSLWLSLWDVETKDPGVLLGLLTSVVNMDDLEEKLDNALDQIETINARIRELRGQFDENASNLELARETDKAIKALHKERQPVQAMAGELRRELEAYRRVCAWQQFFREQLPIIGDLRILEKEIRHLKIEKLAVRNGEYRTTDEVIGISPETIEAMALTGLARNASDRAEDLEVRKPERAKALKKRAILRNKQAVKVAWSVIEKEEGRKHVHRD